MNLALGDGLHITASYSGSFWRHHVHGVSLGVRYWILICLKSPLRDSIFDSYRTSLREALRGKIWEA